MTIDNGLPPGLQTELETLYDAMDLETLGEEGKAIIDDLLAGRVPGWAANPATLLWQSLRQQLGGLAGGMGALLAALLIGGLIMQSLPGGKTKPSLEMAVAAVVAAAAGGWLIAQMARTMGALERGEQIVSATVPMLSVALAAGGRVQTAGAAGVLAGMWTASLMRLCAQGLLAAACATGALAVAHGICGEPLVKQLFDAVCTVIRTVLGALCGIFGAAVLICVLPAGAADNLGLTAAQAAVGSITVVGPLASQAITGVLSGSHLLRSAVGSGGMLLLVSAAVGPALALGAMSVVIKVLAGFSQSFCGGRVGEMLTMLGRVATNILVCALAPAAMGVLLLVTLGSV